MRDTLAIRQIEQRLVELACPPGQLRRRLRELADHHQDLTQEAREEGLSEAEAEVRADARLGEPMVLAEHLARTLRRSSWWGRHPFLGFCVLPPFGILILMLLGWTIEWAVGRCCFTPDLISALKGDPAGLTMARQGLLGAYYLAALLAAVVFCALAGRVVAGIRWGIIACAVCALHGGFFQLTLRTHSLAVGYCPVPAWSVPTFAPLLVAAVFWLRHRRLKTRCATRTGVAATSAWLSKARRPWREQIRCARRVGTREGVGQASFLAEAGCLASGAFGPPDRRRLSEHLPTPTTVLAALLFLGGIWLAIWGRAAYVQGEARQEELRTVIWPAERAAVRQHLATRQAKRDSAAATMIDLKPHCNLALADSLTVRAGIPGNNLTALPPGVQVLAGIPFDVQGRVQLWGQGMAECGRSLPGHVRGIAVPQSCRRIHLLHGAACLPGALEGREVARLLLHYTDGSQASIPITGGRQVFDWWGPIYRTEADPEPTAPGTELAWAGSNPRIQERQPDSSIRLYKTTWENPHPERALRSIEYTSALTVAAPFLVGLTVE